MRISTTSSTADPAGAFVGTHFMSTLTGSLAVGSTSGDSLGGERLGTSCLLTRTLSRGSAVRSSAGPFDPLPHPDRCPISDTISQLLMMSDLGIWHRWLHRRSMRSRRLQVVPFFLNQRGMTKRGF